MESMVSWAGVILAGGQGTRLGGVDKAGLRWGERTLLEQARAALVGARRSVVVGPETGGGPAAALVVAARSLRDVEWLVVLAVDMPRVSAGTVARLLAAADGHDGAVLDDGRPQYLAAAYRRSSLPDPSDPAGTSMRALVAGLDLARVPSRGDEAHDVDTWADLR